MEFYQPKGFREHKRHTKIRWMHPPHIYFAENGKEVSYLLSLKAFTLHILNA